jgi:hypothetical protein
VGSPPDYTQNDQERAITMSTDTHPLFTLRGALRERL